MNIGPYTFEEFLAKAAEFHGNPAPGLIIGGYMVEHARAHLPEGTLFDAIVETPKCLPDAVQILSPLSIGNGWLRIINLGRYALSLYDKYTGEGVRVWIDTARTAIWPEIRGWHLKLKPKKEQDRERLFDEIRRAGPDILGIAAVRIKEKLMERDSMGAIAICPVCLEAYPARDGGLCRACQGEVPYVEDPGAGDCLGPHTGPKLTAMAVTEAVGREALHDMTRVEPGESKGVAFKAGQRITAGDVCQLQRMGRHRVYVAGEEPEGEWVHENEAARAFAGAMAGGNVLAADPPKEGKVVFTAAADGLLDMDTARLAAFNLVPDVMCATRQNYSVLEKDKPFAGCRAIPLYISRKRFETAMRLLGPEPLFRVRPLEKKRSAILVTGTEVFKGLVKDRFIPVIKAKLKAFDCPLIATDIVPDDREAIAASAAGFLDAGAELIITTAGLSVDPDDVTRQGLMDAGLTDAFYGAPVLPGAMTLVGRMGNARVIGVPACALYFQTTSLDLILPRILANVEINRKDLSEMAEGGFCLGCKVCTFPKCPFGK